MIYNKFDITQYLVMDGICTITR